MKPRGYSSSEIEAEADCRREMKNFETEEVLETPQEYHYKLGIEAEGRFAYLELVAFAAVQKIEGVNQERIDRPLKHRLRSYIMGVRPRWIELCIWMRQLVIQARLRTRRHHRSTSINIWTRS